MVNLSHAFMAESIEEGRRYAGVKHQFAFADP